jgi:Tfp pilus assembly protein PilZ
MPEATHSPQIATLLLETGDVRCAVQTCSSTHMEIVVEGAVPEEGTFRLAIYHSGFTSGLIRLLCKVVQIQTSTTQSTLSLQYLALHSTSGRAALRAFLSEGLGVTADEGAFKEGAGGWFYTCGEAPKSCPVERERVRRATGEVKAQRAEQRVVVRASVHFKVAETTYAGQAYNVSENGVYIMSDDILPEVGTPVEVAFPVALHTKPFTIYLRGDVVWIMPGMTTPNGGGVGVRVATIEDGAGGKAWLEYVGRESSFGRTG